MTEDEWLTATEPEPMLEFLRGKASDRKLRIFAIACCLRIYHQIQDQNSQKAIQLAQNYLEGLATEDDLQMLRHGPPMFPASAAVIEADGPALLPAAIGCAFVAARAVSARTFLHNHDRAHADLAREEERRFQADGLRHIIGNPFRRVTCHPSWHTSTITSLAQAIYDERQLPSGHFDNHRLAILADALEESGCNNADILDHCRQHGEHVRGCWVIDLLLGKG